MCQRSNVFFHNRTIQQPIVVARRPHPSLGASTILLPSSPPLSVHLLSNEPPVVSSETVLPSSTFDLVAGKETRRSEFLRPAMLSRRRSPICPMCHLTREMGWRGWHVCGAWGAF
jgi:hypothetical protein